jgi:hypothetical protein
MNQNECPHDAVDMRDYIVEGSCLDCGSGVRLIGIEGERMTDITGIFQWHPDLCPHTGFGLQSHLFDDAITCEGCGEVVEIDDQTTDNADSNKEIN